MGKRGNGQSIKIWNTEKVTAIHTIPPSPAALGISQLLHRSRCALFCLPCSFLRPWRNWGKFRPYLKETSAERMGVRGFCLLSSQSRCPVWHTARSAPSCHEPLRSQWQRSRHCCYPVPGTVSPTEGKWSNYSPSSSHCSSL